MIETTRLKLVPLTHEQLHLYKNNPKALAKNLGLKYTQRQNDPATAGDLEDALEFWIKITDEHRSFYEWYTNWEIILKDENTGVGGIGFAGFPDEHGKSMVGYGLDIRYHGRGIATEALQAIINWGFSHEVLKAVVADTPLIHFPSQRVLQKNGFVEISRDETLIHWQLAR